MHIRQNKPVRIKNMDIGGVKLTPALSFFAFVLEPRLRLYFLRFRHLNSEYTPVY